MRFPTARGARAVSTVAYLFLFPLVVYYRDMYLQAIDPSSPVFSAGFGTWRDVVVRQPRVKSSRRPYEDVVYSTVWLDLRREPWWCEVGEVRPELSFIGGIFDLWGFRVKECGARLGTRGPALVSAPLPLRGVPSNVETIVRGESAFAALVTETRWRDPYALPGDPPVRPGVVLQPMSTIRGRRAPAPSPPPAHGVPSGGVESGDEFWSVANHVLTLVTPNAEDRPVLDRIAEIGVAAGRPWEAAAFPEEVLEGIRAGMDDALNDLLEAAGQQSAGQVVGLDRDTMDRDSFRRALDALGRSNLTGRVGWEQRLPH